MVRTLARSFDEQMVGEKDGPGDDGKQGGEAEQSLPAMHAGQPGGRSPRKPPALPGISIVAITPAARLGTIHVHYRAPLLVTK